MNVVKQNWVADFSAIPFNIFHFKLKKVKKALTQWSRETFGNIFQEFKTLEEVIKVMEFQFEVDPSGGNREKLQEAQAN